MARDPLGLPLKMTGTAGRASMLGRGALALLLALNAVLLAAASANHLIRRPSWYGMEDWRVDCALERLGRAELFAIEPWTEGGLWRSACLIGREDSDAIAASAPWALRDLPERHDFLVLVLSEDRETSDRTLLIPEARRAPGEPACKPIGLAAAVRVQERRGSIRILALD